MAVVVRCTACKGASQVGPEAVGLLVLCPRCQEPFLAIEEAAPVAAPAPKPRRDRAEPIAPVRQPRRRREPVRPVDSHDPHDPPIAPTGGLPVSVLIGFALLPFAIPMLWVIGPALLTQPPALSLAAPISLALSASVLCLAVVFTVDWTPATRIKGVLMLVGLSYFVGLSLYFLKKDMVDLLSPADKWHNFRSPKGDYSVNLPKRIPSDMKTSGDQPLPGWSLQCYRIKHKPIVDPEVNYVFGSGPDAKPNAANWFEDVEKAIDKAAGENATLLQPTSVRSLNDLPGQQWVVNLPDEGSTRVIRVFRSKGTVYYFSVEGKHLDPEGPATLAFLQSMQITAPAGK